MKFEKIGSTKFNPLPEAQMPLVKGGYATGGGSEQCGIPTRDDANDCWTVPMRFWSSDSFENGVWCYNNQSLGGISTHTLNPRS
ncbi:hypothetical protein [Taibaiella koreensis]|uniref:hypothetical protein n=1 Tax=Taibaiella koreensis TaxID=1268548 RepID=UPI0013C2DEE7|nr:hypothetical protein [Taibaiella koreensis]